MGEKEEGRDGWREGESEEGGKEGRKKERREGEMEGGRKAGSVRKRKRGRKGGKKRQRKRHRRRWRKRKTQTRREKEREHSERGCPNNPRQAFHSHNNQGQQKHKNTENVTWSKSHDLGNQSFVQGQVPGRRRKKERENPIKTAILPILLDN